MPKETYDQFTERMAGQFAPRKDNRWGLYDGDDSEGWQEVSRLLDEAWAKAEVTLDRVFAETGDADRAAFQAYAEMQPELEKHGDFGANDTEGSQELVRRVNYRLSDQHNYTGPYIED